MTVILSLEVLQLSKLPIYVFGELFLSKCDYASYIWLYYNNHVLSSVLKASSFTCYHFGGHLTKSSLWWMEMYKSREYTVVALI